MIAVDLLVVIKPQDRVQVTVKLGMANTNAKVLNTLILVPNFEV